MPYLELKSISKTYGSQKVITNLNLDIRENEFLILLGPSGCGKTTLLNIIAGLIDQDDGDILLLNKKLDVLHPSKRNIGMVFQDHSLYPHMTVSKNLKFPLKMLGLSNREIEKKVSEYISMFELHNLLDKSPLQLSGGERQKVAICKALIREPKILLFDEPLSNIDAKQRTSLRIQLKELLNQFDSTIVYVTHDQIEALSLGDRIAVLKNGDILQVDSPQNIYNHPESTFVASFIGNPEINLMNMKLHHENDQYMLICDDFTIELDHIKESLYDYVTKDIIVGIRPENVRLLKDDKCDSKCFNAKVDFIENQGSDYVYHLRINNTKIRMKLSSSEFIDRKTINIVFKEDTLIYFDFIRKNLINL